MEEHLTIEHKVLIIVFITTYFMAMWIQIKDPEIKVDWSDWPIFFFTGAIGAVIGYYIAAAWSVIGFRIAVTVLLQLIFPRTFKFMLSEEAQKEFSSGISNGLINIIKSFFNKNS